MARRMLSSVAQQAKDLRQQLKAVFPLCKFRVRSSNYSMGSSIRVSWMDGPMVSEVEAIAGIGMNPSDAMKGREKSSLAAIAMSTVKDGSRSRSLKQQS
jgi:hypothetical protein